MIAAGFLAERFLMVDGTTFSGFVIAETAEEITILDSDGNEHRLLVDDIDERKALEQSPMPEGLIKDITDAEREARRSTICSRFRPHRYRLRPRRLVPRKFPYPMPPDGPEPRRFSRR